MWELEYDYYVDEGFSLFGGVLKSFRYYKNIFCVNYS